MDDYIRSIAQNNVQLIIEERYNTNPGVNFQKVMLFIGQSEADDFFVTAGKTAGYSIELTAANYADLTKGLLKNKLNDFFAGTRIATAWAVVWDDDSPFSVAGLEEIYTANKTKAYFKLVCSADNETPTFVELCTLAVNDGLFSQCWIGISDATAAIVTSILSVALADAKVVYHSDATRDPALVQLGVTLSQQNLPTGFCVGNSLFFVKTSNIDASGALVDGVRQSITADLRATLESKKVSFFTYIGDGTGQTSMEHPYTIRGFNAAALWIEAFIEYVGSIKIAQLITTMNIWRNNDTYQAILLIVQTLLNQFSALGRFFNAKITAPDFKNLPAGTSIVVPNAWQANFADAVENVVVYGILYIAV